MKVLPYCLFGVAAAMPLAAHGQTFYELESVTTMEPPAEYLKIAMTAQEICNIGRELQNLPRQPPPTTPTPYIFERIWTVSNGRDFVLRKRNYAVEPLLPGADSDCRWAYTWSEQIVIERGSKTTRIDRRSNGPPQIDRNAFTSPWSLGSVDNHPVRADVLGLALRCATPQALGNIGILQPMIGMSEICIPESRVFRDEYGFNLVVQSTAEASLFGGRGGQFRALQRVRKYGVYNATDRTWNPQTYLSD